MEDYSRDLEKELIRYSVPNPFKQARSWQLLFVSDDGKTIAIKHYKGLVLTTLAILIFTFAVSCILSFLYYKSVTENKSLKLSLQQKSGELQKLTEKKDLLETKLWFIDEGKKKKIESETVAKVEPSKKETVKKKVALVEKMRAAAEDISFTKVEGSPTTKIRFMIRNRSKLKRISGFVHVIMKPDLESQQGWLTLPSVALKRGKPAVPTKGRYFSINNFKSMHFKYNDKNLVQVYNNVTIFVFSKTGEQVFESTFPVEIKTLKKKKTVVKKKPKEKKPDPAPVEKKDKVATTAGPEKELSLSEKKLAAGTQIKSETETVKKDADTSIKPERKKNDTPENVTEP